MEKQAQVHVATEVAAFLLKQKLQNDLADEIIVYPKLKPRIEKSISNLQKLLNLLKDTELYKPVDRNNFLPFVYDAEDAVDKYILRRLRQRRKNSIGTYPPFQYFSPLMIQKDLSKGLKNLNKGLEPLKNLTYHAAEHNSPSSRNEVSGSAHGNGENYEREGESIFHLLDEESDFVGQDSDIEKMVAELTMPHDSEEGQELKVISVFGRRGSGKTTTVKRVYNKVEVKKHFNCLAWVCVSRDFVKEDVVVSILEQVRTNRLSDRERSEVTDLDEILMEELMNKRYLIVLDDVWNLEAWHKLTILFPDSVNGSRVILTTCDGGVAKFADPWSDPVHLHLLTNDERWELLLKQIEKEDKRSGLKKEKDKIMVKLSDGLPPEIVLLGRILSTREPRDWCTIIDKFPSSLEGSQNIFALAFYKLPSRFKICFLYFLLFPRGLEIPVHRVLRIWLSEGFLTPTSSRGVMEPEREDLAKMCFETLARFKLIEVSKRKLDGSPKTCRLPWLVHDFLFPKLADSGCLYDFQDSSSKEVEPTKPYMDFRRNFKLLDITKCLDPHDNQHLQSYIYFNHNEGIGIFSRTRISRKDFALLKVLDLEGVWKPMLHEAEVVGNLLLLTFLGLRSTGLDSIPSSVGNLPRLETLDLRRTNVTILPSSIWKAKNLRHLLLEEIHINEIPSQVSFIQLQTLTGLYVDKEKIALTILARLKNLKKLELTCRGESISKVARQIFCCLRHLHSLKLRSVDKNGYYPSNLGEIYCPRRVNLCNLYLLGLLPISVNQLTLTLPAGSLRKLTLSMLRLEEDPMPVLGKFQNLRTLRLFANSYVGTCMTCTSGGFPNLRILKLWMLDELHVWTVEERAMPNMQEIEIRRCSSLVDLHGLEHLSSLNEVILTNMPDHFVQKVRSSNVFVKVNDWK